MSYPVYIWQKENWPNFFWDPEAVLEPLARVSALHGRLTGRMEMLGMGDRDRSQLNTLAADLVGSNTIEGISLNPESVRSSLARRLGLEQGGLMPESHYVEGLVDVMLDAISFPRRPLTLTRLQDWHHAFFPAGMSGMQHIQAGILRTGSEPMQVVSGPMGKMRVHYEAPSSDKLHEEITKFLEWLQTGKDPAPLKAALAHLWFVTLHPFDDGNGRISRTIADYVLAEMDSGSGRFYSMSAEINREKKSYYEILERTQKGGLEVTEWMLWFLECLARALRQALDSLQIAMQKAAYWEHFRGEQINERQQKVLNRLWDGFNGNLTSSKWAIICHCSQDTASRDISALLEKGMLVKAPAGGRSSHYLLPDQWCHHTAEQPGS